MTKTFTAFFVLFSLIGASVIQAATPKITPYMPPHPYPEPDSPLFPQPGNFMMETVGITVDQVNDEAKYFRSEEFSSQMKGILSQIDMLSTQGGAAQQEAFPYLKSQLITAIQTHSAKVIRRITEIQSKEGLNDGICENIDNPCLRDGDNKTLDDKIKADVALFGQDIAAILNSQLALAQAASSVSDLKTITTYLQSEIHKVENQERGKSLATRVFSQTVLHFSAYIQSLVLWPDCSVPYLGANGFNIEKHKYYITNPDSRFKNDWYTTDVIVDSKRPFTTFSYKHFDGTSETYSSRGGKWEYQKASDTFASPSCKGNTACIEAAVLHMRAAKYLLQDIFHIAYWGYDNFLVQSQCPTGTPTGSCPRFNIGAVLQACPLPRGVDGGRNSASPFPSQWPGWPTTTPGIRNKVTTTVTRGPSARPTAPTGRPTLIISQVPTGIPTIITSPVPSSYWPSPTEFQPGEPTIGQITYSPSRAQTTVRPTAVPTTKARGRWLNLFN